MHGQKVVNILYILIFHHFTFMTKFQNVYFLGFLGIIYPLYFVLHQALSRRSDPNQWTNTRQFSTRSLCLFLSVVHSGHVRIRESQTPIKYQL